MTPVDKELLAMLIEELPLNEQVNLLNRICGSFSPEEFQAHRALAVEVVALRKQMTDRVAAYRNQESDSWAANPDRSGGQFTQDELNDTGWK